MDLDTDLIIGPELDIVQLQSCRAKTKHEAEQSRGKGDVTFKDIWTFNSYIHSPRCNKTLFTSCSAQGQHSPNFHAPVSPCTCFFWALLGACDWFMSPVLGLWKPAGSLIRSQTDAKRPQAWSRPSWFTGGTCCSNHMKMAAAGALGTRSPQLATGTGQQTGCQTRRSDKLSKNDSSLFRLVDRNSRN